MITKLRGYSAPWVANKTNWQQRGLYSYPDNLRTDRDDPNSELDYDQWCANLAASGTNLIRFNLTGFQWIWSSGRWGCQFEPPPRGTFNIWHSILNPEEDIDRYRSDQVTSPIPTASWQRSNLAQLLDAAQKHGIKFSVVPFDQHEFFPYWRYHAWNRSNRYATGDQCEPQDRGFLDYGYQCFTNRDAWDAAKARLDILLDIFEQHDVVACWALVEEMTWLAARPEFWELPEDSWDDRMRQNIRNHLIPWQNEMVRHIKQRSQAPVGNGHVFWGARLDDWPTDRNHMMNVINEPYESDDLDIVFINWYEEGDIDRCHHWRRLCQQRYPGKQILIEQYSPWSHERGYVYTGESAPYLPSKVHEWAAVCGEYGVVGPIRWPGIREEKDNVWVSGGYADPAMMDIAGVTATFAKYVDLSNWQSQGESADARISSPALTRRIAWGDKNHVVMMLTWEDNTAKMITIGGLENQTYTFILFNWVTGEVINTRDRDATNEQLEVGVVPREENTIVAYLYPKKEDKLRVPQPVSPADGAVVRSGSVVFEWSDVQVATYNLRVDGNVSSVKETSVTLDLPEGTHTWAVQSVDASGRVSDFSQQRMVTVDLPKPVPVVVRLVIRDLTTGDQLTTALLTPDHRYALELDLDST